MARSEAETPITLPADGRDLIARARALYPLIREHAVEAERARHLPAETVEAYREAGLVRTLMPRRFGGWELDWSTAYSIGIELGRADGSHAWCMSYWIDHAWMLGHFPEQAQEDIWGENPDARIATSFGLLGTTEVLDDGYRLSGSWPWASGITHSDWIILAALIPAGDHPEFRLLLVPRSDFEILDVWHNAGLSATGSDTVVLEDVFVPAHRTFVMQLMRDGGSPGSKVNPGINWQVPLFSASYYSLLGPATGAARGAFEAWVEWSRSKVQSYTGVDLSALTTQQIALASIEAKIDTAELVTRSSLQQVESGEPVTMDVRVRNRRNYVCAIRGLVDAMDELIQLGGASGLFESSPIQRGWRDVHAISTHASLNWAAAAENFGRHRLGLELNPRDPFI